MATTESTGTGTMRRRGVIAVAAATMASLAATAATSERVAATSTDTNYIAEGGSGIGFRCNSGYAYGAVFSGTVFGVEGSSVDGAGIRGVTATGSGYAVYGESTYSYGVVGRSYGTRGAGYDAAVLGIADVNTANAIAVQGSITGGYGIGVLGGRRNTGGTLYGTGVNGLSDTGYGVYGNAASGIGVIGTSDTGNGVYGTSGGQYGTAGVYGVSGTDSNAGVEGHCTTNYAVAVRGVGPSNGFGVYGTGAYAVTGAGVTFGVQASASAGNGYGVYAIGGDSGYGVYGKVKGAGIGVYGISAQYGVLGATTGQSFGIYGVTDTANSAAFAGGTNNASAYAALFTGKVQVNGSFTVTGAKSAALAHPDGSHRLVYCVEAPESWLEDFGEAKLVAGRAEVKFDPDFAAVIDASVVHVFVTEHDGNNDVHVPMRGAMGFTVQADVSKVAARGKTMASINGTFSYRVVAKRKGVDAPRLGKVEIKQVKIEIPAVLDPPPPMTGTAPLPKLAPPKSGPGGAIPTISPAATGGGMPGPAPGGAGSSGMTPPKSGQSMP